MQIAVHSHAFHYTIIVLVIMDALIVLFEFLLDVGAFGKHVIFIATMVIECSVMGLK